MKTKTTSFFKYLGILFLALSCSNPSTETSNHNELIKINKVFAELGGDLKDAQEISSASKNPLAGSDTSGSIKPNFETSTELSDIDTCTNSELITKGMKNEYSDEQHKVSSQFSFVGDSPKSICENLNTTIGGDKSRTVTVKELSTIEFLKTAAVYTVDRILTQTYTAPNLFIYKIEGNSKITKNGKTINIEEKALRENHKDDANLNTNTASLKLNFSIDAIEYYSLIEFDLNSFNSDPSTLYFDLMRKSDGTKIGYVKLIDDFIKVFDLNKKEISL